MSSPAHAYRYSMLGWQTILLRRHAGRGVSQQSRATARQIQSISCRAPACNIRCQVLLCLNLLTMQSPLTSCVQHTCLWQPQTGSLLLNKVKHDWAITLITGKARTP